MAEQFPAIVVAAVALAAVVAIVWAVLRRFVRIAVRVAAAAFCLLAALALWALLAGGCAPSRPAGPAQAAAGPAAAGRAASPDPVGVYDVTMASAHMSESGVMEIRGRPGAYSGEIRVGSFAARITGAETGPGHMAVRAETERGTLVARLARDGPEISGNWVLGAQRGTLAGRERGGGSSGGGSSGGQSSGGPDSTGRSSRPPHSDHDPS